MKVRAVHIIKKTPEAITFGIILADHRSGRLVVEIDAPDIYWDGEALVPTDSDEWDDFLIQFSTFPCTKENFPRQEQLEEAKADHLVDQLDHSDCEICEECGFHNDHSLTCRTGQEGT